MGPVAGNHSESKSRSSVPRDLLAKQGNSRDSPTRALTLSEAYKKDPPYPSLPSKHPRKGKAQ